MSKLWGSLQICRAIFLCIACLQVKIAPLCVHKNRSYHNKYPPVVFHFTSPVARAAIGEAGYKPLYYRQRASRACVDPAVMHSLLVTRKQVFPAPNFFTFILAPLSLLFFLLFCLLFYPCFFFSFLPYCYFRLSCSFLCISKASLEPADYPRVLVTKKYPRAESPLGGINSCIAYIFIHLLPDDLTLRIDQCKNTIRQTKYFLGDAINLFCGYRIHSHR